MKRFGSNYYAAATVLLAFMVLSAGVCTAQSSQAVPAGDVVSRSIKAVSYQVGGSTKIDLKPTSLAPRGFGEASVEAKQGVTNIEVELKQMGQATALGTEFLTYVLWAVSPEGRTGNVGEIQINQSGEGKLKATTAMQTFSLFVTAEPYFAVRQPSEMVVLENELRKGTKGKIIMVSDYKLMKRSLYQKMGNPLALSLDLKTVPLELYEARNAVEIAKSRNAEKYAPDIFAKADGGLKLAENALARKVDKKEIISRARAAIQSSEDARAFAVQKQEEERIANEKAAAAAKAKSEAEAKAAAEAEVARKKADAEAAAAKAKADEEAKRQAELAAAREAQMKAEAETAAMKAKAEADALKAKEEAAKAEVERAHKAAEELRARLLAQLNRILSTRDTPRGLVVTMADVLFDVGKYDLRPPTREKLAQLSGIVLANPGLRLAIEGHTDNTGSDELNQKLSEQRATTVRDFLVQQGILGDYLTAKGFGKDMPIADNSTVDGRKQNRRVELILSGEVIGTTIGK